MFRLKTLPCALRPSSAGQLRISVLSKAWQSTAAGTASWRQASALDEYRYLVVLDLSIANINDRWLQREAKPVSLRQLTVFGRSLTEPRLLSSANYVRTELPTRCDQCSAWSVRLIHKKLTRNRLAHRTRDLQNLPYAVIKNRHMAHVYDMYCKAFEGFRRYPEIKTVADNDDFCTFVQETLREHLSVIPSLVMGVLECQQSLQAEAMDKLMTTLLRSVSSTIIQRSSNPG